MEQILKKNAPARAIDKIREYADFVKFEHTVFALPFALSAMVLACPPHVWPSGLTVACILSAMIGGRTYAMALNRLIDAKIDAANPRTAQRSLPAGRMSLLEAWGLAIAAALVLVLATLPLPPLCVMLLPVAFFILTVYSFVKRFSSLCHLVLGLALGTSAIGGWLAVTGVWSWHAVLLGLAVMFWVAGFDVLYALQDVAFDRSHGLFSLPASWGEGQAILLSRVFHGLTILCLLILGLTYPYTGWGLWLATLLMGLLLAYEHRLVSPGNLTQINEAFFKVNGRISVLFFVCILLDKFL